MTTGLLMEGVGRGRTFLIRDLIVWVMCGSHSAVMKESKIKGRKAYALGKASILCGINLADRMAKQVDYEFAEHAAGPRYMLGAREEPYCILSHRSRVTGYSPPTVEMKGKLSANLKAEWSLSGGRNKEVTTGLLTPQVSDWLTKHRCKLQSQE